MFFHSLSVGQLIMVFVVSLLILADMIFTIRAAIKIYPYDGEEAVGTVLILGQVLAAGLALFFLFPFFDQSEKGLACMLIGAWLVIIGMSGHMTFTKNQLDRAQRHRRRETPPSPSTPVAVNYETLH